MKIVTCDCKKNFAVRIPEKQLELLRDAPKNVFATAQCPHCKMITRFDTAKCEEMEEGRYLGRIEINEKMPSLSKN
jgi:hypothetical protein